MVSLWSLSDSKSPQVSRTLLGMLADLNNAVDCMVSSRPHISKSSRPFRDCLKCYKHNCYHRHFHVPLTFFNFSSKVLLFISSLSFIFTRWSVHFYAGSLFLLYIYIYFDYHSVWSSG